MRSIIKNKKGVLGLNTAQQFVVAILGLAITSMLVLIVLSTLDATSVATDVTRNITANISEGVAQFWTNSPTFFILLAIVVIVLIVVLVIVATGRIGGTGGGL